MCFNFVHISCYCCFRDMAGQTSHIVIRELVEQTVPDNNCEKTRGREMQINLGAYFCC